MNRARTRPGPRKVARFIVPAAVAMALAMPGARAEEPPWHLLALETHAVEHYDVAHLRRAAEAGEEIVLPAGDRTYVVAVTPHVLRSERFRARAVNRDGPRTVIPPRTAIFKGEVVGDPESIARLSFQRDGLVAFLRSGGETRVIRPVSTGEAARAGGSGLEPHETVALDDLFLDFHGTCEATAPAKLIPGGQETETASAWPTAEPAESLVVMEVAIEADFEYFQIHGQDTTASMETLLNVVEGIYEAELGITFEITYLQYYEEDVDPYTTSDALELLNQLRTHWNAEKGSVPRDVVHLLTGRDLDGSTVGIAYVAEVCDLAGAYGLSQDISSTLMPVLVSHELGHNLGSFHDPSDSVPQYIMHPSLSSTTLREFSDLSRQDIEAFIAGVSCLESSEGGGGGGTSTTSTSGGGGSVDPFALALVLATLAGLRWRGGRRG